MDVNHLIRMANQIGSFFEAMPDRPEALAGTVNHLKKFWDPRMRRELLAHIDAHGPGGLSPFVADAVARHRAVLA